MRVATWNIRAAIGPGEPFPAGWWRHVTDERFERICALIRELDADVVALQEVAFYDVDGEVRDQPLALARRTDRGRLTAGRRKGGSSRSPLLARRPARRMTQSGA